MEGADMPIVTGALADIGLAPLVGLQPVLVFTPSSPAVTVGGTVFASKPVTVTPAANGTFSVSLASTDGLIPTGTHWRVAVKFLLPTADGAGYSPPDFLPFKLFVPANGGVIGDLIGEFTPNDLVYLSVDAPDEGRSAYMFQLNTVSGDLFRRDS